MEESKSMKHGSFPNCWACRSGTVVGVGVKVIGHQNQRAAWSLGTQCMRKYLRKETLLLWCLEPLFEGSVCILVQIVSNRCKVGLELLPAPHQGYKATLEVY